jgi:hypothetical protein
MIVNMLGWLVYVQVFPVVTSFGSHPLFDLDRAAVPYFGTKVSCAIFPLTSCHNLLCCGWSSGYCA